MKTFTILSILFMSALFYSPIAVAQMIFNDNMESYTTATATSINDLPNNSTSDPVFWARNSFQGEGSVNATAGITGITGARAAILSADFSAATGFWGAQLFSAANAGAGTALSFADLTYSFTIASSSGSGFYLNFNSFNSLFEATGTYRKAFTPAAAENFETISGNLAEGGWAANPFGLSANGLELNAANYSWSVEISGEFGWTGSNNSLLIDQATFAVLPQPSTWSGGGTNGDWNTSENWNTLPTTNSPLVFTGGTRLTSTNNFAVDTAFNGITFTNTTGDFSLNGNRLVLNGDIIARSPSSGEASHTITTDIFLGDDDRQFIVDPDVLLTVTGAVAENSGSRALIKSGSGTLALAGVNSFGGGLVLGAGTLVLSHASAAGDGMLTQSSNNSTLQINTTGTVANAMSLFNIQTLQTVTLSGNKTILNTTYTVDSGTTTTDSGNLTGGGAITKRGGGTLSLSGSNTYSGATTVESGKLVVDGSISSATTVQSGATLGGSGTVASVTVQSGGTIDPGNSPGTLTITNGLTWTGGGNYNWQIFEVSGTAGQTNTWDLINVTGGTWDINGLSSTNKFNINLWSLSGLPDTSGAVAGFNATQNYSWMILASGGLSGTFNTNLFNINTSAINGTGGFVGATGLFSLALDSNNDLFLNYTGAGAAVPEPGTWAAAALLVGGAAFARWRRRAKVS